MAELDLNRDTVRFLIDTVHEFHSREDVTFPDSEPVVDEEWAKQVSSDFGEDTYYLELKNTINELEPDQQVSLVALMWLGRGDYSIEEWDEAIAYAQDTWTDHTAEYLIGTALLADYLQEGLEQFASAED